MKDMTKKIFLILVFGVFGTVMLLLFRGGFLGIDIGEDKTDNNPAPREIWERQTQNEPPPMTIDPNKKYQASLTTTAGAIVMELFAKQTPITVNNFVVLAGKGFYNGITFHRVIKGFMIQGGDPKGDGTGGPGYQFADEPFSGEYNRGTVAMANSGPNTNGSQFFIMQQAVPLPKNYVIFGKVISGLDTVDRIANAPVKQSPNGEMSTPLSPVTTEKVDISQQ